MTRRGRVALKVVAWAAVPGAARLARLPRRHRRPDRQPDQLHHQLAGRLDAAHPARQPGHDPAAHAVRLVVADRAAPAAGPLRVRLRLAALRRVARPRPLLRLEADGRRHREATLHHGGHDRAGADDPPGRHLHRGRDSPARRGALAAAAPAGLRDRGVRGAALPLARQEGEPGALLLRGGVHRADGDSRLGLDGRRASKNPLPGGERAG